MLLWWVVKIALVVFFLQAFLRRGRPAWAVGLLAVTTAVLLDSLASTWGRERLLEELGFFTYVVGGMLLSGTAFWLWEVLRPEGQVSRASARFVPARPAAVAGSAREQAAVDRQMLYDEIRAHLGPDDVLDLVFDLGLNENDVINPGQDMPRVIVALMDEAERLGRLGALGQAVERVLKPLPAQNLPRREKLSPESPPTLLRQFLVANYSLPELQAIAADVGVNWEELGDGPKKTRVRHLLLYLMRRNQLPRLLTRLQQDAAPAAPSST